MRKFNQPNNYEKLDLLKEPLISDPTQKGLKTGFLKSFLENNLFSSGKDKPDGDEARFKEN